MRMRSAQTRTPRKILRNKLIERTVVGVPKVKKIPQRQCVGCREMKDKKELLRVVKSPEGAISLDFGGRKPGRGAYVCRRVECLQKARKTKALERAFDMQIPGEVYDALEIELEGAHGQ